MTARAFDGVYAVHEWEIKINLIIENECNLKKKNHIDKKLIKNINIRINLAVW